MPQLLDTQRPGVKPDDQSLLVNVFTVPQCDRTEEGDAFIPPDPKLVRKNKFVTVLRSHMKQCSNLSAQLKVNTRFCHHTDVVTQEHGLHPEASQHGRRGDVLKSLC